MKSENSNQLLSAIGAIFEPVKALMRMSTRMSMSKSVLIALIAIPTLLAASLTPRYTHAAVDIVYDVHAERNIRSFLTPRKFEETFVCESGESFENSSRLVTKAKYVTDVQKCQMICTFYCKTICDTISDHGPQPNVFYVQDCTADKASIYSDSGIAIEVTKESFESKRMSWLPALLEQSWQFIDPVSRIEVFSAMRGPYEITDAAGEKTKIDSLQVRGTIYPKIKGSGSDFLVHLSDSPSGLLQVLSFGLGFSKNDDNFFSYEGAAP